MAYVNKDNPNCANCNKSGLAILPVRYAVVPTIANAELPASLGNKVTSVALKHNKYALRTLRKGYFYLYYEKHARGRDIKWEVYSVSESGTLWKQNSIGAIKEVAEIMCSSKAHLLPASVITIDTPEKCGRVWMAFSEHQWSEPTFKRFEQDLKLRDRRMQVFEPASWITQRNYVHGFEATEPNLNQVIEYKSGFALSALGGTDVGTFSKPDGTFDHKRLNHCSTMHPVTVRRDDKVKLVEMMKKVGEVAEGSPHSPVIIALWDCVGVTHELNGFRNDAMGWLKRFKDEREFELEAATAIEGAKTALAEQAATISRINFSSGTFKWDADATRSRLQAFDMSHGADPIARHREMDLCDRWERDALLKVPTNIARQRAQYTNLAEPAWQARMSEIDLAAGPVASPAHVSARDSLYERDQRVQQVKNDTVAHSWDAYEPRIDRAALDAFLKERKALCIAASALADKRTEDVVAWLTNTALQDAMLEFHGDDPADGEFFTNTVGNLIFGIETSPTGLALIKAWVDSKNVTENNLVWRCFSLNNKDGSAYINKVLESAAAHKETPFNELSFDLVKDVTKNLAKLGQLAQKGLALHNALRTARVSRVPTGGIEKVLLSVGNFFLQPFVRKTIDTLSEGLIMGLLLARSGSQHVKIMNLLLEQARCGTICRAETLMALQMGQGVVSNRFKAQKEVWSALAKDADIPKSNKDAQLAGGYNESKQLAFGMVATILQSIFFWKLYSDSKRKPHNEQLSYALWATGFSLGAGLADLFATGTKLVNSLGDRALTFQALKLGGGLLSAASAWTLFEQDLEEMTQAGEKGNDGVALLYFTKGGADAIGGIISLLSAVSYTEPAFILLAEKFPSTFFGRSASIVPRIGAGIAERLLITRALLLCTGIYVSIAIIAIQLLIWKYTDDALQDWCDGCAFGRQSRHRFPNSKTQMDEFNNLTKDR